MPQTQAHTIDRQIGQRLKKRRKELGLTMAQMGSALGVSYQQIQRYEKGTTRIAISKLFEIAYQLQVPITYFVNGLKHPANTGKR